MFVINPWTHTYLSQFGIEVPIHANRVESVFRYLQSQGVYKYFDFVPAGHLEKSDFTIAHSEVFVNHLFDKNLAKKEIESTYELLDHNGDYNRYNPKNAQFDLSFLAETSMWHVRGTRLTCEHALRTGFSFYLGGGLHHAMKAQGRGFCLVNDIVCSLKHLQKDKKIKTAWVIDIDAHKGDGTAQMTEGDPSIISLSIHMQNGWPLDTKDCLESWIPSDIDIPIGKNENSKYLEKLKEGLSLLEKQFQKPDIAIIVQGSDPYENDVLPSTVDLKLNREQMLDRDLLVYNFLEKRSIPQAYVMAGGYGPDSWIIYRQFLEKIVEMRFPTN
jgi:acetoin utilization deacetylase AcuC-like enzyme